MRERSSKVELAFKDGCLLISGHPYDGVEFVTKKRMQDQSLEKAHQKLFREAAEYLRPNDDSLEQPYPVEEIETVTTYSVHGDDPIEGQ